MATEVAYKRMARHAHRMISGHKSMSYSKYGKGNAAPEPVAASLPEPVKADEGKQTPKKAPKATTEITK